VLLVASLVSFVGLTLLLMPWPVPMAGFAFLCAGAWLAFSAARSTRRRSH
jgi:hypothetical protein